jgi:predicted dehydrogenase
MNNQLSRRTFLKNTACVGASAFMPPVLVPSTIFRRPSPNDRIQIGQIGCGRIARGHDLPETIKHEVAQVIACSDVDAKRMLEGKTLIERLHAERSGVSTSVTVRTYSDYREMLADPEIDAVIISTPDHWHAQPAVEAALAGKDIYLQKPASLTISEGRQLSDIIHRTGCILQIGSQQRSMPQFHRAAELVRNGRIGNVHTIRIGLPSDPSGPEVAEMPIPKGLNYDAWLGSTDMVYYTELRVHPQNDYSRPGWLRCRQFGAGMITGWGSHHVDSAHWAIGAEHTGPVSISATAAFPSSGIWDVHGDYDVWATYENGTRMHITGSYPNGVRFEGDNGWLWVTRGDYVATASDPTAGGDTTPALDAEDRNILTSEIGADEVHLHNSNDHHGDWLQSIRSRKPPVAPVEVGHRACSTCLVCHIGMQLGRELTWNPVKERFENDDEANQMRSRPQRIPYGTELVLRGFG